MGGLRKLNNSNLPICTHSVFSITSHSLSPQTEPASLITLINLIVATHDMSTWLNFSHHIIWCPWEWQVLEGNNLLARREISLTLHFHSDFMLYCLGRFGKELIRDSNPPLPLQIIPWQRHLIPDLEEILWGMHMWHQLHMVVPKDSFKITGLFCWIHWQCLAATLVDLHL